MLTKPHTYLICILITMCQMQLFGQRDIAKELKENCNCPEFDKSRSYMDLLDITKSTNEIEIRLASFSMGYNSYSIISYNKRKYDGICYIAKHPNSTYYPPKPGESPYNKYVIKNIRLDSVLNELLHHKVSNWTDPGFKNKTIPDLGMLLIQYKVNQHTGFYTVQPPFVLTKDHPEIEAYKALSKVVETFRLMTDSVFRLDSKRRDMK